MYEKVKHTQWKKMVHISSRLSLAIIKKSSILLMMRSTKNYKALSWAYTGSHQSVYVLERVFCIMLFLIQIDVAE